MDICHKDPKVHKAFLRESSRPGGLVAKMRIVNITLAPHRDTWREMHFEFCTGLRLKRET